MKKIIKIVIIMFVFLICDNAFALSDGNYIITSSLNSNKAIDLASGMVADASNIQIFDKNNTNSQLWSITKTDDNYYIIKLASNPEYCIDLEGGEFGLSKNVQLNHVNESDSQKWKIEINNDNTYSIKSFNEEFVIDIVGAQTKNCTNVQIYSANDTKAQKFNFTKKRNTIKTIDDGLYKIETLDQSNAITINSAVQSALLELKPFENQDNQKWNVKYLNNGYYMISSNINNSYVFDVIGNSKNPNTKVQIYTSNSTSAQAWIIESVGNDEYRIISKGNDLLLDYDNTSKNMVVNTENEQDTQKFRFTKVENTGSKTINDGYYFIASKINNNKMIDVHNGEMINNQNVQLYESNSSIAQKWYIKYNEDGYYSILCNRNETYSLTYEMSPVANVKIEEYDSTKDSQKWIIKNLHNGYYSILNKEGLVLDIVGGQNKNGANIQVYESNLSNAQQFKFQSTANGLSDIDTLNGYYFIESAVAEDYVFDLPGGNIANSTNLQLYKKNSSKAQKWHFSYSYGYYKMLSSKDLSKAFDVPGAGSITGTNLQIYTYNGTKAQQWVVKDAGDGYYYISSNCNGLYLTAIGDITTGFKIKLNSFTGNDNQKFKFEKTRDQNVVIDISSHQGDINWNKVKSDAGIYGVIVRVAAGSANIDKKLKRNTDELKRLKIPYGLYIYSYAENQTGTVSDLGTAHEAELEARRVLKAISDYNLNPKLGIYYDLEVWDFANPANRYWSSEDFAPIINYFGNTMTNAGYSNWRIYTNLNLAKTVLSPWKDRITWIAQWSSNCTYDSYYNLWQYTSGGSIPGISGNVDLNYYYID